MMTGALMRAMSFTEADLQANRSGELSRAQMERMKLTWRRQALVAAGLFMILVILATSLIYAGQRDDNQILALAGTLVIVVNAILIGVMGRAFMRLGSDLRAGNIEVLTGDVERVLRRGRQGDNYLIRVDSSLLQVPREVFLSFRHEARYRIYRTAHARLLLSAEAID